MSDKAQDIYAYVTSEEARYDLPITVLGNWEWGMKNHIEEATLYKNSQLTGNKMKGTLDEKPVKNIVRPILNLQYRAEGFDVKDITLYITEPGSYFKSFLVRKYHEKYAREHGIDTLIDGIVESYVDNGGALVKKTKHGLELVPLASFAFCDQTDILSGPFALKHPYSPSQLLTMSESGWGDPKNGATMTLEALIEAATEEKSVDKTKGQTTKTPGRYIEVYEVHGTLPERFLTPDKPGVKGFVGQLHIIAFYTGADGKRAGATLFKGKETDLEFRLILRDKIFGRALGFGGVEELTEDQIWTNYGMIRKKEMLDSAAKTIIITDDPTFAQKNNLKGMDNLSIAEVAGNTNTRQLDTYPRNFALFDKLVAEWGEHAQIMGAAGDAIMGEQPASGTPFKLQELVTSEAHSLHDYRKGKLATFVEELYRWGVLPDIVTEICEGTEFLAELSLDELQEVADQLAECKAHDMTLKMLFSGNVVTQEDVDRFKEDVRSKFMKGGNKRFLKLLKDELKDVPVDISINIVGKQKYLSQMVDKLTNVFRQILAAPQVLDDPRMAKLFNQILEASGLSPVDFYRSAPDTRQGALSTTAPSATQLPPGQVGAAQSLPVAA
jgi:hypothetical protein